MKVFEYSDEQLEILKSKDKLLKEAIKKLEELLGKSTMIYFICS